MKTSKHLYMIPLLAVALSLTTCGDPDTFTLVGTLRGLPDGTKVTLIPAATHQNEVPLAETSLREGRFEIAGQLPEPHLFYLHVGEGNSLIGETIMLEAGHVTVDGEVITGDGPRWRWKSVNVEGSKMHQLYKEKMAFRNRLDEAHAALQAMEASERADAERAFFRRAGEEIPAAIAANGDSFWGPLLALVNYNYFDSKAIALYEAFSPEAKESYYGQILYRELFPERLVGKPLPAFSLPDRHDKAHADGTLREGKRLVVIDFWASWCAPCRREIPRLKELYAAFAPRGLEIISLSIDKNPEDWKKALDEEQMPWPNLLDTVNLFGEQFNGKTIPALFLVDANG
ncbi:MAG: AhpC/TSA family protein, partial [Odoribacteraceae bacterium]|nr:AhpC/TSA family protein [Odoribacteraceae bacterium]